MYMRRTKEDSEKTKVTILNTAIDVFVREGFSDATLEEIAKEAGVTRGAIYWHFQNKSDLFQQLVSREDALLRKMIDSVLTSTLPPFAKLQKLLDAAIDNFYDNSWFRKYVEITWYKLNNEHLQEIMQSKSIFVQNFILILEDLLRQSVISKEIKTDTDIELSAFHISSMINGFYRLYFVAPDRARDKAKTKRMFKSFFNSIATYS